MWGFYEFVIPPRVETQVTYFPTSHLRRSHLLLTVIPHPAARRVCQLRADIKKEQEAKLKAREARMARLQRMQRKEAGGADPEAARVQVMCSLPPTSLSATDSYML